MPGGVPNLQRGLIDESTGALIAPNKRFFLPLAPETVAELQELLPALRAQMLETQGAMAAWIGKGPGTIVRLAALLALMHWAQTPSHDPPHRTASSPEGRPCSLAALFPSARTERDSGYGLSAF